MPRTTRPVGTPRYAETRKRVVIYAIRVHNGNQWATVDFRHTKHFAILFARFHGLDARISAIRVKAFSTDSGPIPAIYAVTKPYGAGQRILDYYACRDEAHRAAVRCGGNVCYKEIP